MNYIDELEEFEEEERLLEAEDREALEALDKGSTFHDQEQAYAQIDEICQIYMETIDLLNDPYEEIYSYPEDIVFWLFYKNYPYDLEERILAWLRNADDENKSITRKECVIYVNLSYEPEEVQEALKGLPFSMLWDVYAPVIKTNRIAWRAKQKALDGSF
jgi:PAS domain-containing protein